MSEPLAATPTEGLVVEVHGMLVTVAFASSGARVRCRPPRDRQTPVIGDRVRVDPTEDPPRIVAIGPRERSFARCDPSGPWLVATHLDRLVIVTSVHPGPRLGLIDRMWVALSERLPVVIVLNKVDLPGRGAAAAALVDYAALGVPIVETCVKTGAGISDLAAILDAGLSVFAGHSGVGKSSLLNRLIPGAALATGAVHDPTGKGRHTTTVATVHRFGTSGLLVDTPGVRAFPLVGLPHEVLATRFPGFDELASHCHFAGCLHEGEPGCAVADEAPPERVARWRELLRAVRDEEAGPAPRVRAPPPGRRR